MKLADQVHVLRHRFTEQERKGPEGPQEFIVELNTVAGADRLILAKVHPGRTLQETVQSVLERV
jgi:hypothetical protein